LHATPPATPDDLLDLFLAGSDLRTALAEGGVLNGLKKALAERVLRTITWRARPARAPAATASAPRRC
jgi:hypothetical protein